MGVRQNKTKKQEDRTTCKLDVESLSIELDSFERSRQIVFTSKGRI